MCTNEDYKYAYGCACVVCKYVHSLSIVSRIWFCLWQRANNPSLTPQKTKSNNENINLIILTTDLFSCFHNFFNHGILLLCFCWAFQTSGYLKGSQIQNTEYWLFSLLGKFSYKILFGCSFWLQENEQNNDGNKTVEDPDILLDHNSKYFLFGIKFLFK